MDTSANLLIEELNAILADHKSQIIDMVKEDADEALLVDVEANLNRMITDAKELFNSSYQ
jgi:MinD-like ATPase involved in chromosome partitioning or flagellar assembly|tara:strand:- start:392 stop:571 length:180 start_codon:yes stop_codon:yes gene_type:complete